MEKEKKKGIQRFLDFVERGGNKLPHPLTLFWIFCVIIAIISAIAAASGQKSRSNTRNNIDNQITFRCRWYKIYFLIYG